MNKTLFTDVAEVKTLLGITGSDLDGALAMYLQSACNIVCSMIGAHEIISFSITDEIVNVQNSNYLDVKHLPVQWDQPITIKNSNDSSLDGTFYGNIGDLRTIRGRTPSGRDLIFSGDNYKVSYEAGFVDVAAVPVELKMLAALICQASILKVDRSAMSRLAGNAEKSAGQLKRYSIGSKTVEYFDPSVKAGPSGFGAGIDFEKTVTEWAAKFKKFNGFA